jgi:hypothetical protein
MCLVSGHHMHTIASTLRELGRNNDALVLQEEVVDFYKRVLPHNDPRIGPRGTEQRLSSHCLCRAL